jgi:hypothetical protein
MENKDLPTVEDLMALYRRLAEEADPVGAFTLAMAKKYMALQVLVEGLEEAANQASAENFVPGMGHETLIAFVALAYRLDGLVDRIREAYLKLVVAAGLPVTTFLPLYSGEQTQKVIDRLKELGRKATEGGVEKPPEADTELPEASEDVPYAEPVNEGPGPEYHCGNPDCPLCNTK